MSRKTAKKSRKNTTDGTTKTVGQIDDFDLPYEDAVLTGAAADASDDGEPFTKLPPLLRYAVLIDSKAGHIEQRLIAEIDQLCRDLPLNAAWAKVLRVDEALLLADELDRLAVAQDRLELRSLADCVRMVSLPLPRDAVHLADYRRVTKALLLALGKSVGDIDDTLLCQLEAFCFGWAALLGGTEMVPPSLNAAAGAVMLGARTAFHRITEAKASERRRIAEQQREKDRRAAGKALPNREDEDETDSEVVPVPEHHLVVARVGDDQMKNIKLREILGPLKRAINVALPLVVAPPLHRARQILLAEFPYAVDAIDFVLADLVGRATVKLRPTILVGPPGGGKSRFARRVGEILGLSVWREDASRADGAVFGGTDRRWYSAEPCHPFLAIARAGQASVLIQLEELEKAATRADYGRLFDCLLGFLEPESCQRYPDPALQVTLDLSEVSYIATANSLDPLPGPLRDRLRVVEFPEPRAADLKAMLPAMLADSARERGLDGRWMQPIDDLEYTAIARAWRGGSVRRLRRIVEAILRQRELRATRN
jgi:ATP-dependent Lon protease